MYLIAICEDKPQEAREIAEKVRSVLDTRGIAYRLDVYPSCDELLFAVAQRGRTYHILFLDILMEGLNGMEFAKKLRGFNRRTTIVFVTVTLDFALEGYAVHALRYLHKPVRREELQAVLEEDYAAQFRTISVRLEGGESRVRLHRLLCIEARGHRIVYHMPDESIEAYPVGGSLSAMARTMPRELVRCHRCYIVNLHLIRELRRDAAVMENGMEVPVGRKWFDQVQDAYLNRSRPSPLHER